MSWEENLMEVYKGGNDLPPSFPYQVLLKPNHDHN